MAQQDCYVFASNTNKAPQDSRKRRKNVHSKSKDDAATTLFVPLMRGVEDADSAQARYELFAFLWQQQEETLNKIIDHTNTEAVKSLKRFIYSTYDDHQQFKIPTGLLLHGPGNGALTHLSESLSRTSSDSVHNLYICLNSGQGSNLKTILKCINQAASRPSDGEDETITTSSRLLNYDLQLLCDQMSRRALDKVVVLFEDSEAFDGGLLSDLIGVFNFWKDRVPFVLLFGIATSIELFQSKLSRTAIRCLEGKHFIIEQADPDEIFKAIHGSSCCLFLGSELSRLLMEQQKNFIQDPRTLMRATKYAYMTHLFSNPLSLLVDPARSSRVHDKEHSAAIRQSPSFRRLVQRTLDSRNLLRARKLLDDDTELHRFVVEALQDSSEILRNLVSAVELLYICVRIINTHSSKSVPEWSELYILAMSNRLTKSILYEEVFASLRRAQSKVLQTVLNSIKGEAYDTLLRVSEIDEELAHIVSDLPDETALRSSHDIQHSNVRTTVVAQKVELSKYAAKVTAEEAAYTKIIDKFIAELEGFFESRLINPQELFLQEVFIYDVKSLHREVFTPHPRFAIERALSSPHDYLGCDCCDSVAGGLSASQPATAIVYQLYLESGSVINIADLWSAFWTIKGPEGHEDEEEEEGKEQVLALFFRALAELEYLGMIKNSRKKADHLAKLLWKGL